MASITINPVSILSLSSVDVTGVKKILGFNSDGKPATIAVNKLFDKLDDLIDESIEDALDDLDTTGNLKWNDVYD